MDNLLADKLLACALLSSDFITSHFWNCQGVTCLPTGALASHPALVQSMYRADELHLMRSRLLKG
jgi:hypothetical protein